MNNNSNHHNNSGLSTNYGTPPKFSQSELVELVFKCFYTDDLDNFINLLRNYQEVL